MQIKTRVTMKWLLFIFSILIYSNTSGQTETENYVLTRKYLREYKGDFQNTTIGLVASDLIVNSSSGANGSVSIADNVLNLTFSGSWSSNTTLKQGNIKSLSAIPNLPNLELGDILSSGVASGYKAKILNGSLFFYSPIFLNGINTNLTTSITGGSSINYSTSITTNIYTCPNGGGGGFSGNISIVNGNVTFYASGGWSDICSLKLGNIQYLNTSTIPNTELGIIKSNHGIESVYKAKIENNWLVFYTDETIPQFPLHAYINVSVDLTPSNDDKIESITYYDGLGRAKQTITKQGGGNKQDIITPIVYDELGRQIKDYLPYAEINQTTPSLNYRNQNTLISDAEDYYLSKHSLDISTNFPNPYSEKQIESSPLSKVLKQAAPGYDWMINTLNEAGYQYNFQNFSIALTSSDLLMNPGGTTNGSISMTNSNLTLDFTTSWTSGNGLKTGVIKPLNDLPDMELGNILSSGVPTGYQAKIENSQLMFYSDVFISGVNTNINYTIPGGSAINYNAMDYNSISDCGSGSGSMDIEIQGGILDLYIYSTWSPTCSLKTGNIHYFNNVSVPNCELGVLNDQNGNPTFYKAKIENNWLVFYTDHLLSGFTTANINSTIDLKPYQTNDDHTIKFEYLTNAINEVELFKVVYPTNLVDQPQLYYEGYYEANELYKTITKDENWLPNPNPLIINKNNTTEEFKDKEGRTVLKRTFNNNIPHDTYYIYDDLGNLTYVLSPKGSDLILYNNKYLNFSGGFKYSELIPIDENTNGNGYVIVNLDSNSQTLSVDFDVNFSTPINLRNGPIGQLSTNIPNIIVGYITSGGVNYVVSILDGYLHISGEGLLTSVTDTFIINLPGQSIDTEVLNNLCYQYRYDSRNRLVEKKIPQKGWEYTIYDKLDRPVLTQDVNLRDNKNWLFSKYDVFDRVAYTGLFSDLNSTALTRRELQELVNSQTTLNEEYVQTLNYVGGWGLYYTNNTLQLPSATMLWDLYTVNYYDMYNPELTAVATNPTTVFDESTTTNTKSLATGGKVKVLGTDEWVTNVIYYDDKARPIYTASRNDYLATTDIVKMKLDFVGKTIKTESSHIKDTYPTIMITDDFTYDHAERLLTQKQQIGNGSQELIVKNIYDELGQLITKNIGNTETSPLQTVDYKNNVRGWLIQINDPDALGNDLFGFKIGYNKPEATIDNYIQPQYNGNISETIWKTKSLDHLGNPSEKHAYNYTYDSMNRLTVGNFGFGDNYTYTGAYKEYIHSYDKNGNILKLYRNGKHATAGNNTSAPYDDLTYQYNGNQLTQINDLYNVSEGYNEGPNAGYGVDYTYDANGNLITDASKGITSIEYNHLNLPIRIVFSAGGPMGNNEIKYVYDALGVKLKKEVINRQGFYVANTETMYAGKMVYQKLPYSNNCNTPPCAQPEFVLKFFSHPEGYVEPDEQGNFDYAYQYKDHLGSVRLSYSDVNGNGSIYANTEILQEQNTYPFGLQHKGYNNVVNGTENNFKTFLGQEINKELGLNWLTFRYRNYIPEIGRFFGSDPIAEKFYYQTNYQFASNNPVWKVELEGLEGVPFQLIQNAVENPNGLSAHGLGLGLGFFNAVKGLVTAVSNPVQTFHAMNELGSPYPNLTKANVAQGVVNDFNAVISGNGIERGEVVGRYTTEAFIGRGTSAIFGEITNVLTKVDNIPNYSKIGSTGVIGENYLKTLGGDPQQYFKTTHGGRYVDQLVDGAAYESKVGYTTLTKSIKEQIAKDVELLSTDQVKSVNWIFFESPVTKKAGASQPLLNALQEAGIKTQLIRN